MKEGTWAIRGKGSRDLKGKPDLIGGVRGVVLYPKGNGKLSKVRREGLTHC